YAATTDRDDFQFDRVTHQFWGGDRIDLQYYRIEEPVFVTTAGSLPNPPVYTFTVVNDRAGNVDEYLFNASNQMLRHTERTGQADPTKLPGIPRSVVSPRRTTSPVERSSMAKW
ncbi:unnamed protein product, partial [marine sediment metagenome]